MKQFAVLFACLLVGVLSQQSSDYFERLQSFKPDCIKESKAKPDLVERLVQAGEFNDDKDLKCFLKCLFVKMRTMNAAGEIQEDAMRSQFPPRVDKARVDTLVQKCKDLKGGDACETAFNVAKCSYDVLRTA